MQETDLNYVDPGIDVYLIIECYSGPIKYFDNYLGRFKICHVEDMNDTPDLSFEFVGNGIIDFRKIFDDTKNAC